MRRVLLISGAGLLLAVAARPSDASAGDSQVDLGAMSLEQLMQLKVQGAALHPQTLQDAPASVTIITAGDIRKYGYRTLGEALASVRGFYTGNNRTYETVGVRGFNSPGDYASRFLIMVNGHNMADNVFDFMLAFDQGFPIETSLIKQIEVIRGPSSALYGTNGMFATVNIITKTAEEIGPASLITDIGSFGEKKGQFAASGSLGGVKALLSGTVFNNSGQSPLYFPEFNNPQSNFGQAIRMNGERGYHFFTSLTWRNWAVTAAFGDRDVIQPISWGPTIFNDRGTNVNDRRDFVEAAYSREIRGGTLRWRTYYDEFVERARFDYPLGPEVEENIQDTDGKWIGTALTYRFDLARIGTMTVGSEAKADLRAIQRDQDIAPAPLVFLNTDDPDRSFALFAQDERKLSSRWTADLGARFDYSLYRRNFFAPRAALIYQPTSWTYKFLYGRSFRNPSAFQLFYSDNGLSGLANPAARSENADTVEVDAERRIGKRLNLVTSAYGYILRDLLVGQRGQGGLIQYRNVGKIHALGLEVELSGRPASWLETTVSYSIQNSTDDVEENVLENSPVHLAKLRFAVPLGRRFEASSGMQYFSSRQTLATALAGPVYLADFTITSRRLLPNFDVQFGLRNVFNRSYSDPIALNPLVDTMHQPGRTLFVELIAHAAR
ncbi:MAG TPA: TonB-dependent receptor [Bryobacteraceae bacterium]|nr:TonB-dependent receptor [Bryobacteraceae bacterium]